MSQTIVPAAPSGGPPQSAVLTNPDGAGGSGPAIGTLGHRVASASATIRHYLDGSPGRLRIVSALAVMAAVIAALGGGAALRERSAALDEARSASAHLVLLQRIQTGLVQAEANATNSYLGFGLEPVNQRLEYINSLHDASRDLALAANASPEDARALGAANAALTRYSGYIGSARANNRFGKPVGANYLSTATDLLSSEVLNQLRARTAADEKKIDSAYSRSSRAALWLILAALVGLGILVWAQFYLARHSRRVLNIPLLASTAGLLVAFVVAGGAMAVAQSRANDVRNGSLTEVKALSESRVNAFDAKSTESLTLIARGSGPTNEPLWAKSFQAAQSALPAGNDTAAAALTAYQKQHQAIRKTDDDGNWRGAVEAAISQGSTSANAQFQQYADATEKTLTSKAEDATSGLDRAGNLLLPAGILVVLVGLLAALGAWFGVSLRLDEYR